MSIEAMKLALEALEWNLPVVEDWGGKDNLSLQHKAITALRQAIEQAEKQEPVAWRNAAIRIGEELSSVGPNGYYDMTAQQWIDWAMEQEPKGKTSLPQPKHEWVGLTDEEINKLRYKKDWTAPWTDMTFARAIEAKLKEKNT
jgi:hypothetical protein